MSVFLLALLRVGVSALFLTLIGTAAILLAARKEFSAWHLFAAPIAGTLVLSLPLFVLNHTLGLGVRSFGHILLALLGISAAAYIVPRRALLKNLKGSVVLALLTLMLMTLLPGILRLGPLLKYPGYDLHSFHGTDAFGYVGTSEYLKDHGAKDVPSYTATQPQYSWVNHVLSDGERPIVYQLLSLYSSAWRISAISSFKEFSTLALILVSTTALFLLFQATGNDPHPGWYLLGLLFNFSIFLDVGFHQFLGKLIGYPSFLFLAFLMYSISKESKVPIVPSIALYVPLSFMATLIYAPPITLMLLALGVGYAVLHLLFEKSWRPSFVAVSGFIGGALLLKYTYGVPAASIRIPSYQMPTLPLYLMGFESYFPITKVGGALGALLVGFAVAAVVVSVIWGWRKKQTFLLGTICFIVMFNAFYFGTDNTWVLRQFAPVTNLYLLICVALSVMVARRNAVQLPLALVVLMAVGGANIYRVMTYMKTVYQPLPNAGFRFYPDETRQIMKIIDENGESVLLATQSDDSLYYNYVILGHTIEMDLRTWQKVMGWQRLFEHPLPAKSKITLYGDHGINPLRHMEGFKPKTLFKGRQTELVAGTESIEVDYRARPLNSNLSAFVFREGSRLRIRLEPHNSLAFTVRPPGTPTPNPVAVTLKLPLRPETEGILRPLVAALQAEGKALELTLRGGTVIEGIRYLPAIGLRLSGVSGDDWILSSGFDFRVFRPRSAGKLMLALEIDVPSRELFGFKNRPLEFRLTTNAGGEQLIPVKSGINTLRIMLPEPGFITGSLVPNFYFVPAVVDKPSKDTRKLCCRLMSAEVIPSR